MCAYIEFFPNIREKSLPLIKLTRSKNGKTGTATFLFVLPEIFDVTYSSSLAITKMSIIFLKKKLSTSNIKVFFKNGNPFFIKSVFLFRNSGEWFQFLQFINLYSKQSGLLFSENN